MKWEKEGESVVSFDPTYDCALRKKKEKKMHTVTHVFTLHHSRSGLTVSRDDQIHPIGYV